MTLGAIPLAIEAVNADPSLLPGRKLQFVSADIGDPGKNKTNFRWVATRISFWKKNPLEYKPKRQNVVFYYDVDAGNGRLTALAIRRMTEMRDNNSTIAFIGPDGQCAAEALVAAAWNLPMITHVIIEFHFLVSRKGKTLKDIVLTWCITIEMLTRSICTSTTWSSGTTWIFTLINPRERGGTIQLCSWELLPS